MKIAISSTGKGIESQIDARFGRCVYFVIAEVKDKKIEEIKSIENPSINVGGGAGISAAELVANEGVKAVITGNVGPRAISVFSQFGIKVYSTTGKVKDALDNFVEGKLEELNSATGPMGSGNKEFGRRGL
ncbi:NifB/NifX family molybdenum-iron cluster-binding protein [Candidatus Micrarchaeota archaeon]|nr:NifB/NifX family molybdenum-iron cluster-binding protein [Candidatus Micrarchaeota archaeon]